MSTYQTAEIATIIGVHPNTVRLYEKWKLIPKPKRQANGYRVFTDFHIQQFQLARIAFQIEILQKGLRRKIVEIIKISAQGDFDKALTLTQEYLAQVQQEHANAEESIKIVKQILSVGAQENTQFLTRKEVSKYLNISTDSLRNWEMNGLLTVRRKQNGYRVYMNDDLQRLKIIRSLRCANYSLEAILRMFHKLSENPDVDIKEVLNTPKSDEDIISVCDKLIISLLAAEDNANIMIDKLQEMKSRFQ